MFKRIVEEIYFLNRSVKKVIIFFSDAFLLFFSTYLAHTIQLNYLPPIGRSLILYNFVAVLIYLFVFVFYKKFNIINRHFDLNSITSIFISTLILALLLNLIGNLISLRFFNLNFIIFQVLIFLFLISSFRIFIRNLYNILNKFNTNLETCVIFGSGENAYQLAYNSNFNNRYFVSHFIDEDKNKIGQYLGNKRIISIKDLKKYNIKKCFFCAPSLSGFKQKEIASIFSKLKISIDFRYNNNLANNKILNNQIDLNIKKTSLTKKNYLKKNYYFNKTIFVTGGAGSIGSEICFQLYNLNPKKIIIIDNNEYNLAKLKQSLLLLKNQKIVKIHLVNVCDFESLKELFSNYKPNFVFHAAAYKHVDIVEENSNFSIKNNILGLNNVLKLSEISEVENFIFISTDKAVRPKNIMGLTKKIGEIFTTYYASKSKKIVKYNSVRFGNVIGSSGSFLQIFKRQLDNGGPITVTSKKATRYFMTINDAVNLVIQAPFLGGKGNTFVLKMGDPVNIYKMVLDLIKKNRLKIKNKNTGDIKIKIIGLREGEKLHEELFETSDNVYKTKNPLILVEKNYLKLNNKFLKKFY